MNKNIKIEVNGKKVKRAKSRKSERKLGVHTSLLTKWIAEFEKMKEKMLEAMLKLNNATLVMSTASAHCDMHLIKKMCFGSRAIDAISQQEVVLKKTHEPTMLKKLGLSENFPCAAPHSRKTALGVESLVLRTIIDEFSIKLCLRHRRADDRISGIMQIIEDNTRVQCGCAKSPIDVN